MLETLVTPVVAIAILLAITFPIWFLVLLARFVHHVGVIAGALSDMRVVLQRARLYGEIEEQPKVANSIFGR